MKQLEKESKTDKTKLDQKKKMDKKKEYLLSRIKYYAR